MIRCFPCNHSSSALPPAVKKLTLGTLKVIAAASAVLLILSALALAGHLLSYPPLAFFSLPMTKILLISQVCALITSVSIHLALSKRAEKTKTSSPRPTVIKSANVTEVAVEKKEETSLSLFNNAALAITNPSYSLSIQMVRNVLAKGSLSFKKSQEYQTFYYHLTMLTDFAKNDVSSHSKWEAFLTKLNGSKATLNRFPITLDCSPQLHRLKGEEISLRIEELGNPTPEELQMIKEVISEAFEDCEKWLDKPFFTQLDRCFVTRDQNEKIVAVLSIKESPEHTQWYVHTLARRANMVKTQVTQLYKEKLATFFETSPRAVFCHVDNPVAKRIYEKLGFRVIEKKWFPSRFHMKYSPNKPL